MNYFIIIVLIILAGQVIILGEATDPGLKKLFEQTHPLSVDRLPHQYNLWWRLINYTANTEGLSDCYVCANAPHSTDKPFRLQPVSLPEIQIKCLIWLQAMFASSPESSCNVWLSMLRYHLLQLKEDVKIANECTPVCAYMYSQNSIPWILHSRLTPPNSMPTSLQVQGKVNEIIPMCICQNAGLGDKWLGHSNCARHYVNIEHFWGASTSSGNLWSTTNLTSYTVMTNNGLLVLTVYPDSIIPATETAYIPLKEKYWICGNNAYHWLPKRWSGCCYIGTLNTHLTFLSKTGEPLVKRRGPRVPKRIKRALKDYKPHLRISSGVKTLEGIFPWYGTIHNAYLIDNISLELETFAEYAIEDFIY